MPSALSGSTYRSTEPIDGRLKNPRNQHERSKRRKNKKQSGVGLRVFLQILERVLGVDSRLAVDGEVNILTRPLG